MVWTTLDRGEVMFVGIMLDLLRADQFKSCLIIDPVGFYGLRLVIVATHCLYLSRYYIFIVYI